MIKVGLIEAEDRAEFVRTMQGTRNQGWEPVGGVAISMFPGATVGEIITKYVLVIEKEELLVKAA